VGDCDRRHYGRGMCQMHWQRWNLTGSTDDRRAEDFGKRKKHPLWPKWSILKKRQSGAAPEWLADFWRFVDPSIARNIASYLERHHMKDVA